MGYSTDFSGSMKLSRPLTVKEALEWLCIKDRDSCIDRPEGSPDSYLQWVPSCDLQYVVWDGGEKFYYYIEWMRWIALWLQEKGITIDGRIDWSGDEVGDHGTILVTGSTMTVVQNDYHCADSHQPLTLSRLKDMALADAAGKP